MSATGDQIKKEQKKKGKQRYQVMLSHHQRETLCFPIEKLAVHERTPVEKELLKLLRQLKPLPMRRRGSKARAGRKR